MKSNRKFPYLSAYLQKMEEASARDIVGSIPLSSILLAIALAPVAVIVGGILFGGLGAGAILAVGFAAAIILAWTTASRKRKLRTDPREQRRRKVFQAGSELKGLEYQRKLHRWMDPVALHLLEAGAFHWTRIQTTLQGPQWGTRDLPVYWSQLKQQVIEASNEGMADLLLMTRTCVGPPQKDRESDIKGVVDSFVDLDLADALQGLKQMAKSDWTAYAYQSPQANAVAVHGRLIAERLKDLADDVESKTTEITAHSATSGGLQSLEALDGVLGELRTVRQAESELEQRIETRQ